MDQAPDEIAAAHIESRCDDFKAALLAVHANREDEEAIDEAITHLAHLGALLDDML